jgi:hypothetical protein
MQLLLLLADMPLLLLVLILEWLEYLEANKTHHHHITHQPDTKAEN